MVVKHKSARIAALIGTAITVLWLSMMFSLFRNHVLDERWNAGRLQSMDDVTQLTKNWNDVDEYMLLAMGSSTIGAASTSVRRLEVPRPHYEAEFRLGAKLGNALFNQTLNLKGAATLDAHMHLSTFHVEADIPGNQLNLTGLCRGSQLYLKSSRAGKTVLSVVDMKRQFSFLEAVRPSALNHIEIKPGTVVKLPVVDPMLSMQQGDVIISIKDPEEIKVNDKPVWAYRVEMRLNNFVSVSWVDKKGTTLKRQLIGSLVMEKTSKKLAAAASSVIDTEIKIPEINVSEFDNIPVKSVDAFAAGNESPLSLIAK